MKRYRFVSVWSGCGLSEEPYVNVGSWGGWFNSYTAVSQASLNRIERLINRGEGVVYINVKLNPPISNIFVKFEGRV